MSDKNRILMDIIDQEIAVISLNRPEKLNAFTLSMVDLWLEFLETASRDPAVKVIVLTGVGRAFCAGGDIDEMIAYAEKPVHEFKDFLWRHVQQIPLMLDRIEKPVIAAFNGLARGAGLDMGLMCDIRLAAESAVFGEAYINMGMIAGDGGTYFLPRLVGTAKALELFWTGRDVSATEAERIGLVNTVVADDQLMTLALDLARKIAAQPQEAIRLFKRTVYQGLKSDLPTHLDMVSSHMAVLKSTPDHQARIRAFKRRKTSSKP